MNQSSQNELFLKSLKVSEAEIIKSIQNAIANNAGKVITYFNQNSFNEYYANPKFREILQSGFEIFCDGKGMSLAVKILIGKKVDQFNATDLFTKIFDKLFEDKIPVYVIGSKYDPKSLKEKINQKIILAGYSNGFEDIEDQDLLVQKILQSNVRIIGIGMGTPKQEILASQISIKLGNCIILCVGNFFNFYLGFTKRAPFLLRNSGLEWVYRLIQEPGKLWKRYIIGIPQFLLRVIKYKFS
jgi:N-acetylglucosaminyldiphosphoundecaprenol N-acetyl-beta-D-mannosaminyltransferase